MTARSKLVQPSPPAFAAFLSYDRDDAAIGDQVHRALEGLGGPVLRARPPFFNLRARRVFRDVTNIATSPDLRAVLREAMGSSSHFILLASPRAAESEWITFEIESWLELHGGRAANLLLLLVDGDILWDKATGDFDWSKTNALPRVLANRFDDEPLWSDLRGVVRNGRPLSLRNAPFRSAVAEPVASIEGRSKDEIVGRHIDVRRRIWTGTALVAIAVAALAGGLVNRAREVSRQRVVVNARQSLAEASEVFTSPGDPDNWPGALRAGLTQAQTAVRNLTSKLPALQAVDEAYMRDILTTLPGEIITLPVRGVQGAFTSDDGRRVLLDLNDGAPRVWDVVAQRAVVEELSDDVVFDGNLRTFAWPDSTGHIAVDVSSVRTSIGHVPAAAHPLRPVAVSADGSSVAYIDKQGTLFVEDARGRTPAVRLCDRAEPASVAFSRAKNRLAALCGTTIRVWASDGSKDLARFNDTLYSVVDAEFSDDGTRLGIATLRAVRLWSVDRMEQLAKRQITDPDEDEDFLSAIAVDDVGYRVAINIDRDVMTCVDLATGETVWPRIADWDFAERGRMVPDATSKTVAYRTVGGGFTLFDVCTGNRLARIAYDASSGVVTYNDRSRRLAITTPDSGTVHIITLRSADLIRGDELSGQVTEVRAAARAPIQAIRTDEHLVVWNTQTAERLLDSRSELSRARTALSDDGSVLALIRNDTVSVWRCLVAKACGAPSPPSKQPLRGAVAGGRGAWVNPPYLTIFTDSGSLLFRLGSGALEPIPLPSNPRIVAERPIRDSVVAFVLVEGDGQRLSIVEARGLRRASRASSPRAPEGTSRLDFRICWART